MTNCHDNHAHSSAPATLGSGTPDSPIPAAAASNMPSRSYSRNSESNIGTLADRKNNNHNTYPAGRSTQSLSREELLSQTIARLSIHDERSPSASSTNHRLRPKPLDISTSENRFAPLCGHDLDDATPRSGREWIDHSRKDDDKNQTTLDRESDVGSDAERETEGTDDETPIHQEEKPKGDPQACLFVASLAATRTDSQLAESVTKHFQKWGSLMNVKVLKDWMQRPYSFVQFETIEDAQRAMIEAQNTIVDGRHIRIEQARVNRTLFILRFSRGTTEQDLIDALEQYGPVEDVSIFHDPRPNSKHKRYAFAKFAYRDDAISAYTALRATSKWTVEWAPNLLSQNQIEKESVFVGQLNPGLVTEGALQERFQDYGNIKNIHLVKRNNNLGVSRTTAFAFIEYDSEQAARRAIDHENNTEFLDTTIRVQHRETSEYRIQRQNAAMQAARNLVDVPDMPRAPGAPVGPHGHGYGLAYQPYRGPGAGRPIYYPPYYGYPGMPLVPHGYYGSPLPSQSSTMMDQPGGAPRGPPFSSEGNRPYHHGSGMYNQQNNQAEHYGSNQNSGQGQRSAPYDYNGYGQGPDGMYYPPPPPPGPGGPVSMYNMYEHNPSGVPPVSGAPAPGSHGGVPPPPPAPGAPPVWYAPAPMTGSGGGGMARRPGLLEVSAVVPPRYASGPQQNRGPEGPSSSSRGGDSRGSTRKTN
ncbi:hypothetical protein BGZ95_009237 [Linnemannia exigua]|uniref:RRM domain-containing protein n=1 Tax=Linnemannia exigua TaxID=604196 RepID=A0AAD4DD61_9FUNG|nr:hypothetical protein BGZ95_009237 [Linnemannia exigua]